MEAPKISTAADFIAAARARRVAAAVPLALPSGLSVLAYRPAPEWWMRHIGRIPESIAVRLIPGAAEPGVRSSDDIVRLAKWTKTLLCEIVVAPEIKLEPAEGELDPYMISQDDFDHLIRFAGGEIEADGQGLDSFSGNAGSAVVIGATG